VTFSEFSAINRLRSESPTGFNHALGSWSLSDWMTATMGELGEAANVAKKLNRVRDGIPGNTTGETALRIALVEEIADVFIYLDLLAQSQGFSLGEAVRAKFNKTSRKLGCAIEC
jgi:NTP pyrophosphatase (non-canonical NTP hydrolase)